MKPKTSPDEDETWKVVDEEENPERYIVVHVVNNKEDNDMVQAEIKDTSNDSTTIFSEGQVREIPEKFFYEEI